MLDANIGFVTVNVLTAKGTIATDSSAQIIMTITGRGKCFVSRTNDATNGVAIFRFYRVQTSP